MNRHLSSRLAGAAVSLILALTACGGEDEPAPAAQPAQQQTEARQVERSQSEPRQSESSAAAADSASQQRGRQTTAQRDEQQQSPSAEQQPEAAQRQEQAQAQAASEAQQSSGGDGGDDSDDRAAVLTEPPQTLQFAPILDGRRFEFPIELIAAPDGGLLIAEQRGSVTWYDQEGSQRGVLDLTDAVAFGGERGLLSIALDPRFEREPYLYVYYSPRGRNVTRLSRFRVVQGEALSVSEMVILEIQQPYQNHNGGAIRFGPDGMLYLGIGDGGAANDPQRHGQNLETLLGTIIRIDVRAATTEQPYRIPSDNPFVEQDGVLPEIFAWGLRNPWRMAFDPLSGLLWVGDVGQNRVEEIAIVEAGSNHGWNIFEGDECFGRQEACDALAAEPATAMPAAVYGRDFGCSVIGGEVYRGRALPKLDGVYLFGDYCSSIVWGLWEDHAEPAGWAMRQLGQLEGRIASFGVDEEGELYALIFGGPILKLVAAE